MFTSEALGMQEAEACVAQAGAAVTWDEETQQNYAAMGVGRCHHIKYGWKIVLLLRQN